MSEQTVRNQYNQMAAIYDRRWHAYVLRTLTFLKAWATIPPHATVLDVGCGTGTFARLLLEDQPTRPFIGVDLAFEMLRVAVQKCADYPRSVFAAGRASAAASQ